MLVCNILLVIYSLKCTHTGYTVVDRFETFIVELRVTTVLANKTCHCRHEFAVIIIAITAISLRTLGNADSRPITGMRVN